MPALMQPCPNPLGFPHQLPCVILSCVFRARVQVIQGILQLWPFIVPPRSCLWLPAIGMCALYFQNDTPVAPQPATVGVLPLHTSWTRISSEACLAHPHINVRSALQKQVDWYGPAVGPPCTRHLALCAWRLVLGADAERNCPVWLCEGEHMFCCSFRAASDRRFVLPQIWGWSDFRLVSCVFTLVPYAFATSGFGWDV